MQQRRKILIRNQRLQFTLIGILLGGLIGSGIGHINHRLTPQAAQPLPTPTTSIAVQTATAATAGTAGTAATATRVVPSATPTPTVLTAATATKSANPPPVSNGDSAHLIRSVNMSLFDSNDQLANNAGTQALLANTILPSSACLSAII